MEPQRRKKTQKVLLVIEHFKKIWKNKVMEIPDKLYLSHLIYGTFQYQVPDPDDDTQVEYIRKDALIKRAEEWFRNNITNNPKKDSVLVRYGCVSLGLLITDFKKYINEYPL